MINHYDPNLFINKSVLAKMAGVSTRTFRRYLAKRRPVLESMGISAKAQKLPPQAVRYLCEDYCIDLKNNCMKAVKDGQGPSVYCLRETEFAGTCTNNFSYVH